MKVRNPKLYREWILMERRTDTSFHNICEVCDKVLAADWLKEEDKLYFHFTKAGALYNHARELLALGGMDAFGCFVDAMNHHLVVCDKKDDVARDYFERCEEYCANTMHNLVQVSRRFGIEKDLLEYIEGLCARKKGGIIDPVALPLADFVRSMPERAPKSDLSRTFAYLSRLDGAIRKGLPFFKNKILATDLELTVAEKKRLINIAIKANK
jgi:hypothetical protein